MKIILLRDLFGKERGDILETVPCPISDIKFYFDLWVDGEKEPFRVLDGEFLLKEQDNSGKMFTKFLRKKFCLEGKEKAIIEFLKLDPKMNMDIHGEIFEKIINGDAEFINKNEDELELKEEEDILYKAYLDNKFEKYFIFENNIYTPKYFITDLGDEDFDFNIDFSIDNCIYGKRASFYCKNRSDIIFQGIIEDVKTQIICEKVNVDKTYIKNSYKEVKYSYESMKAIGYSNYCDDNDIEPSKYHYINKFAEKAEEDERKELYENIKEEVLKKSPTFPILINDVIYDIPEYPFKIWRHTLEKEDKSPFIKLYGEAISPSGIKLKNDDPYHNDWIIGAGINPEGYYSLAETKAFRNFLYGTKNNYIYINQKTNENDFIVFTKQKEPDLEDILNATDTGDIVVTTNISKTSHLVNNCKELNVSLIGCFYDLKNMIYVGQNGICYEFTNKGIPLNQAKKGKAGQLALLKNNGFPVLDGIFFDEKPTFIRNKETMIFRSAGLEESDDLTASGLFKSIIGEGLETFDEVWNSFSSELANKYLSKLNKKVSPGILVQPYIEADESSVIKYNNGELNVSYIKGPCSKIVNGEKDVLHGERKETKDFLEIFKKIQEFTQENIEVEFLKKDEKIFILQLTKLK